MLSLHLAFLVSCFEAIWADTQPLQPTTQTMQHLADASRDGLTTNGTIHLMLLILNQPYDHELRVLSVSKSNGLFVYTSSVMMSVIMSLFRVLAYCRFHLSI